MNKEEIKKVLEEMYEKLDTIQESDYVQDHEDIMFDIGETMACIDNVLDEIQRTK